MTLRLPARRRILALAGSGVVLSSLPALAQNPPIQANPTTQPGSQPPVRRITMEQAIAIGLNNSKGLQTAALAIDRARGRVNESRAGFLPSVSGSAVYTRYQNGQSTTFPDANGNPQTIDLLKQNQKTFGVSASLPLDIVGQIRAAVKQSEFQEIAARLDYNRARNQVVLDVRNAFFDVLRAKAFVTVAEQTLQNARDQQTTAEANLRAGTGTRFDVLRAQTEVANAQQNLIAARNRVNLTNATLNNVLNLDQNTPLDTVDETPVPGVTAPPGNAAAPTEGTAEKKPDAGTPVQPNTSNAPMLLTAQAPQTPKPGDTGLSQQAVKELNAAVEEAYRTRPEVLQADANIRALEKGVQIAQRSYLPSLSLTGGYQYTPDVGGFGAQTTQGTVGVTLSVPLFDQGLSRARTQQARADVNTAKVNKQVTLDSIALEVRQQYLALVEAQDRLNVTTAALTQAQEQYRLAQVRFRNGVTSTPGGSPLLEISDAQNALTTAQNNQVNAQFDLQNARARLEKAVGRYAFDGSAKPGLPAPDPKLSTTPDPAKRGGKK